MELYPADRDATIAVLNTGRAILSIAQSEELCEQVVPGGGLVGEKPHLAQVAMPVGVSPHRSLPAEAVR
jgi:hypothetical protein